MGPKITVDSATLANKGLELIEAHFLFGLPYERIEVVVHPTSVVHALVRFRDGAALAHLGYPDMRVPISYALTYPERAATPVPPLDLSQGLVLEFEPPDLETFPLLALARRAGEQGGTYPCAFNAANEVAVAAFLEGRLPFLGIASLVEDTLAEVDGGPARDLPELVEADAEARRLAERELVARVSILVAILGLAFLILVHEAGHFFVARGVGMRPRKFYLGFPPALVKVNRGGIEYGIGAIPLGGYVKIPGMHRPAPSDVDVHFGRAIDEAPRAGGPVERLKRALDEGDFDGRASALPRSRHGAERRALAGLAREGGRARPDRDRATRSALGRVLAPADLEADRRHLRRARRRTSSSRSSSSPRSHVLMRRRGRFDDGTTVRHRRSSDVLADSPAARDRAAAGRPDRRDQRAAGRRRRSIARRASPREGGGQPT